MQTTLLGLAIAFIVALIAALIGPYFVDWSRFRPQFEAEASRMSLSLISPAPSCRMFSLTSSVASCSRAWRIAPSEPGLKIPHMGWNTLNAVRPHPLLDGLAVGPQGLHAYFVHSFRFACNDEGDVLAGTDYGGPIAAVVGRDNLVGTQFHPDKSQAAGLRLIANFLRWRP